MKKILIALLLFPLFLSAQFSGGAFNQSALYINQQIPFCPSVDSCLGLSGHGDTNLVLSQKGTWVHISGGGSGGTDTIIIQKCVRTAYYRLTSSEVLNSFSSPVTIVASPGAGKYIQILNGSGDYSFGTIAYTSFNSSGLIEGDVNNIISQNFNITAGTSNYNASIMSNSISAQQITYINSPVQFYTQNVDPTDGNGTVTVQFQYVVIDAVTHTVVCPSDTFYVGGGGGGSGGGGLDSASFWSIHGNAGTDPSVNFLGTTDSVDLRIEASTSVNGGNTAININGTGGRGGVNIAGNSTSNTGVIVSGTSITGGGIGLFGEGNGVLQDIQINPTNGLLVITDLTVDNSPVAIYTKGADGFVKETSPPTLQSVTDVGNVTTHNLIVSNSSGQALIGDTINGYYVDFNSNFGEINFYYAGGGGLSYDGGVFGIYKTLINKRFTIDPGQITDDRSMSVPDRTFNAVASVNGVDADATTGNVVISTGATAKGNFSQVGSATVTFTVTIGSTLPNNTYVVNVTPTDALATSSYYVSNKTTTTFDVVYAGLGLTGSVTFDWALFQ